MERCESIASTCLVTSGNSRPPIQPVCLWPVQVSESSRSYLCRSKARTVPSRDALTMTKPLDVKVTLVTLLVCSVKVTKHRPLVVFHTFTCQ